MGKFTLEIDLTDDTMCWGCPAKSTDNEGDWSCNITYTALGFTELIRPAACPLQLIKPAPRCESCVNYTKPTPFGYTDPCYHCCIDTDLQNNYEPSEKEQG